MSNKILVSVIIPIYNAEKFLKETIQSVLDSYLKEFELILVNDGSKDSSKLICEYYSQQDNRIKIINQINSGVSVARNNGLLQAKGEYVFFMDSDDVMNPDLLESSYIIAKKEESDIVVLGKQFCRRMPDATALPTWGQLLKLDFLNQYPDIRFPKNIQPCEDGLFSHQLLAMTQKISLNPNAIYHYRHHDDQNHLKINEDCWKVIEQIPTWFDILEQFYSKYNIYRSHSSHLARFVEHEPFEFRYLGMPLDHEQRIFLYNLINEFMKRNVLSSLDPESKKSLSKPFLYFLNSKNSDDFDKFYVKYARQRKNQKKLYLFLIKFIPLKKIRRKLRSRINEIFNR